MKYLFSLIFLLVASVSGFAQTNFTAVMVDSNSVVQRPTNFLSINRILTFDTNGVVIGPTNLTIPQSNVTGLVSALDTKLGFNATNGQVQWTNTNALTFTNSITASGTNNLAPSQVASSGSSLMTRDLSDDRYSFSRWYDANDLLAGAQNVGANPLVTGNGAGHVVSSILVTVSNANTKFMMPIDYRINGEVKVVSYWTDRSLTNGGTNGDIAVWTLPFVAQPTDNTTTNGIVNGTQIKNTFTANYGGSGNARFYVMEQTLNFATVTNISATNPMQLKWIELQRRGDDATDTSSDSIYLSGVHIYIQ